MLDIGWSELLVIGAVALIVVGPKELPKLLRTIGQFVGKARSMAREFQRSMDEAAREADLKELTDLKRDFDKMARVDFKEQAKRSSESLKGAGRKPGAPVASDKAGPAKVTEGAAAKPAGEPAPEAAAPAPTDPAPAAAEPPADTPEAPRAASGER